MRDEGREPVVVAEPDLRGRHRVVLVDDRDRPHLEQLGEGAVGVAVVAAPGHVVDGEEHLAHGLPVPGELLGVAVHEEALPDGRGRLLRGEVARAPRQAQRREPRRDRTRRDQHHLAPRARTRPGLHERTHT